MKQKSTLKNTKLTVLFLSFGEIINLGLGFLKSLLVVRICGSVLYGQYQYLAELVALASPFHQYLYRIPERFFVSEKNNRAFLLWANIVSHLFVLFTFSFGIYFLIYNSIIKVPINFQNLKWIFILLLIIPFNTVLKSLISYVLRSAEEYLLIKVTNITVSFFNLIIAGSVFLLHESEALAKLEIILSSAVFLEVLVTLFYFFQVKRKSIYSFPPIPTKNPVQLFKLGIWAHRSYVLPLIGQYFSGYLKNSLPALLLGNIAQFETITYYQIAKKVYGICHRVIPSTIRTMLPTVVLKKHDDNFIRNWKKYTLSYMGITLVGACLYFFSSDLILYFYKLEQKTFTSELFFFFAISLMTGAWAHANEPLVLAKKSTTILFPISLVRQGLYIGLIVYFSSQLNAQTFAMVHFATSIVPAVLLATWISYKNKELSITQFYYLGLSLILIGILLPFK
jgi:O-antigen/teichoic acid export membrane protein